MKRYFKPLLFAFFLSVLPWIMPTPALARLAGYPLVLVHGFQPSDLQHCPSPAQVKTDGYQYWIAFWDAHADARIDWSSCGRVQTSIAQAAWPQIVSLSESGQCGSGCVFVTHSTGDLVLRYLLANQAHWLEAAGLQPLHVIAVLDFGGAGGGDSLANIAIDAAANNAWYMDPIKAAVKAWLGYDIYGTQHLGVLNDLVPTIARSIATAPTAIPHLRFVGGGWEYLGLTKPFLPGRDDSVVALQSACGAAQFGSYDSCVGYESMEGEQTQTSAPTALWYNYYPVLMGAGTAHSGLIGTQTGNTLVPAFDDFEVGTLRVAIPKAQSSSWSWRSWSWKTYVYVPNSQSVSMSQLIYSSLN